MRGRASIARKIAAVATASALALSLSPAPALAQVYAAPEDQARGDAWDEYCEPVEQAAERILQQDWTVPSEIAPDAAALRSWVSMRLDSLELPDVILRVMPSSYQFVPAVDGTAAAPQGIPGRFSVQVVISRSFIGLVSERITIAGAITAAAYTAPEEPAPTPVPPMPETPEDPVPPMPEEPEGPGTPDPGPADPDAPTPADKAVAQATEQIKASMASQPEDWEIQPTAFDDASFDTEASAEQAVRSWVGAALAERLPDGISYELGAVDVVLPTETEAGRFSCEAFLAAAQEEGGSEAAVAALALEGAAHPLSAPQRSGRVGAAVGESSSADRSDGRTALIISGTIAPRGVKTPSEAPDDSQEPSEEPPADTREPIHPLALRTMDPAESIISTEAPLDGVRVVKRPNQLNGEEAPASMSSIAVQHGSSIAATSDSSQLAAALSLVVCAVAGTVILISLRHLRRQH